jgi:hypothetical protein
MRRSDQLTHDDRLHYPGFGQKRSKDQTECDGGEGRHQSAQHLVIHRTQSTHQHGDVATEHDEVAEGRCSSFDHFVGGIDVNEVVHTQTRGQKDYLSGRATLVSTTERQHAMGYVPSRHMQRFEWRRTK